MQPFRRTFLGSPLVWRRIQLRRYASFRHKASASGLGSKRYQGWLAGAGVGYGYSWVLGKRWNLEATLGLGYVHFSYDRFECKTCGDKLGSGNKNYFGPTKAAVSLIYIIK